MKNALARNSSQTKKSRSKKIDILELTSRSYGAMKQVNEGTSNIPTLGGDTRLEEKIRFTDLAHRATHIRGMWVPTVILESGRGVPQDAV